MIVAVINLIFETKGSLKFLENCWDIFLSFSICPHRSRIIFLMLYEKILFFAISTARKAYSKIIVHLIYMLQSHATIFFICLLYNFLHSNQASCTRNIMLREVS